MEIKTLETLKEIDKLIIKNQAYLEKLNNGSISQGELSHLAKNKIKIKALLEML